MNDLSVGVEQEVETMTSLELAEAFGQKHFRVMDRLKDLSSRDVFNGSVCGAVEYKDAKGEMRPMLVIDFNLAMAFAAESRKKNAPALLMQLMMKVIRKQQPEQKKIEASKPELLATVERQAEALKSVQDAIQKSIANPEASMSMHKHDLLMSWVDLGWLEYRYKMVPRHTYKITDMGKDFLYRPKGSKAIRLIDNPGEMNI